MKKKYKLIFLILSSIIINTFYIHAAGNQDTLPVMFRFALAQKDRNGIISIIEWENTRDMEVRIPKNSRIELYIEPYTRLHIYIYALDSEHSLSVVHENQWYEFYGDAEYNQFFLIVAGVPFKRLEKLTGDYNRAEYNQDSAQINTIKHDLIEEIRTIQNMYVTQTIEIKPPPPVTGSIKGTSIDESVIYEYTVPIKTETTYVRTIRFYHEE